MKTIEISDRVKLKLCTVIRKALGQINIRADRIELESPMIYTNGRRLVATGASKMTKISAQFAKPNRANGMVYDYRFPDGSKVVENVGFS